MVLNTHAPWFCSLKNIYNMYSCGSLFICVHVNDEISCTQKFEVNRAHMNGYRQGSPEYETV